MQLWQQIKKFFTGKEIAIIGQQEMGKTAFKNFLLDGQIPESYEQTKGTPKTKLNSDQKHSISDLGLKRVRRVSDAQGNYRKFWKSSITTADIIVYVIRAEPFKYPDKKQHAVCLDNMIEDIKEIRSWVAENKANRRKQFAVLITHWDIVGGPDPIKDSAISKIENFEGYSALETLIASLGGRDKVPFEITNLLDPCVRERSTRELLQKISCLNG